MKVKERLKYLFVLKEKKKGNNIFFYLMKVKEKIEILICIKEKK